VNPRFLIAAARILLLAAVAVIVHLATTDRSYPVVEMVWDKAEHAAAFVVLSLLVDLSFPERRFGPAKIAALLAFGAWIEVVQYFLPGRDASLRDVVADGVGIALYALLIPLLGRFLPVRRPAQD